jgi:hypothetical protein
MLFETYEWSKYKHYKQAFSDWIKSCEWSKYQQELSDWIKPSEWSR